jgi:hypothetical protein
MVHTSGEGGVRGGLSDFRLLGYALGRAKREKRKAEKKKRFAIFKKDSNT